MVTLYGHFMVHNGFIWSRLIWSRDSWLFSTSTPKTFRAMSLALGDPGTSPRDFTPKKPGDFGDFTGFNQEKCWFNGMFI